MKKESSLAVVFECKECGEELTLHDVDTRITYKGFEFKQIIEPCATCLERATDDGYDKGFETAKEEAELESKEVQNG
jgi:hypothetical protein